MAPPRGRGGRTISAPAGRGASPSTEPGTPPIGSTASVGEASSVTVDSRRMFEISADGRLLEPRNFAHTISECFKLINNPTGFTWKLTPPEIKEQYFEEFKKYFRWPPELENAVYEMWQKKAARRFSGWHNEMKERRPAKPSYITDERWAALNEYWARPEVVQKSDTASRCRNSEPEPGVGISKHRGGSRSSLQYSQTLSAERGCSLEATVFETFKSLHYKKGQFSTEKAAMIYNEVEATAAEQGPNADKNAIYLNLDKARDKKRRLYGLGEDGSSLLNNATRGSTCVGGSVCNVDELRREVQDSNERTRKLEEEMARMREFMSQMLSKDSRDDTSNNNHSPPPSSA